MVGHNPPLLSVSFSLSQRRLKDTRENIATTKEFTVNIISEAFAEAANCTSAEAPAAIDEWILSGLTPMPSTVVSRRVLQESAVSLECELYFLKDLSPPDSETATTTLAVGLIKTAHVHESGFDLGRTSWKAAKPTYELLKARGHLIFMIIKRILTGEL
ncbi:hypothetical protein R3P38DRAFT_2839419, partial [Favolaschia claudopus]